MEILSKLLAGLRYVCSGFPDNRIGRVGNILVEDFGLSAFSMFFMQSESFLSYQRNLEKGQGRSNCETLFGINKIPSDNYIRKMLDEADPALLQPCFEEVEKLLLQPEILNSFQRLDGRFLIAFDGTEYFCSQKIACPHCQTRKRSNGKTECYHSMLSATLVASGHNKVIPLMPEFITPQDGHEKQDCEREGVKRWYLQHKTRIGNLRPVYLGDDLFSCQPIIAMIKEKGDDFIFTCKESSHKTLYDFMQGADKQEYSVNVRERAKTDMYHYSWFENVPLRDGKDALHANWIGLQITDNKGKIKYSTAFVTSLAVTKENVAEMVACGRARWKIENEGFNILKNNGYELEHNFGHGKKFLAQTLVTLNLLAFAWHTILDSIEKIWQNARNEVGKRTQFFRHIITLTTFLVFPAWKNLLTAIGNHQIESEILVENSGK